MQLPGQKSPKDQGRRKFRETEMETGVARQSALTETNKNEKNQTNSFHKLLKRYYSKFHLIFSLHTSIFVEISILKR